MFEARAVGLAGLLRPVPSKPSLSQLLAEREERAFRSGMAEAEASAARMQARKAAENQVELARLQEELAAAEACFATVVKALEQAFADALAELAISVSRAVLGQEPAIGEAGLKTILHDLLTASGEKTGRIIMAPGLVPDLACPAGWQLVEDDRLPADEVRVEVDGRGIVDSIERRMSVLEAALRAGEGA